MTSAHRWVEFLRERAAELLSAQRPANDSEPDTRSSYRPAPLLPPLHVDRPADAAILDLFSRIKTIEDADGSWNGGDVVAVLADWFEGVVGIDITADVDTVEHRLRTTPHPYTVIGLRDNDSRELLVAGVLPGTVTCVDSPSQTGELQRVALDISATDPGDAERRATHPR